MENQTADVKESIPYNVSKEILSNPEFRQQPMNQASLATALAEKKANEKSKSDSEPDDVKAKEAQSETDKDEIDDSDEDKGGEASPGRSKGIERKFKKLTSERTALKEQNDLLLAKLAEIETKLNGKTGDEPAKKETSPTTSFKFDKPKPKLDDFDTVADHAEAVAEWTYEKNRAKERAEAAETEQKQTFEKTANDFFSKGKAVEKELGLESGEWEATVRDEDFKISTPAAEGLKGSEYGAQIAYEIGSDDKLKDKFNKMTPIQQLTLIGKLEAKYESKSGEDEKQGRNGLNISKAQPPAKNLKSSTKAPALNGNKSMHEIAKIGFKSQREYKQIRNQLLKK